MTAEQNDDTAKQKTYELSEFLESVPPQTTRFVSGFKYGGPYDSSPWEIATADVRLFCNEDA